MQTPTYYATGRGMTGSSGFTNYFGRPTPEDIAKLHTKMKAELGEHVIVDGDDDLRSSDEVRMYYTVDKFTKDTGRKPLAYYHTGVSGITRSGIVLTPEDFDAMTEWYEAKFGKTMEAAGLKLIFNSDSSAL